IMGSSTAEGENRALKAVEGALSSPLLKDNEIEGARYILLNISSGLKEVTMDEVSIITDYIQEEAGLAADLIWGNCVDDNLGEQLSVTIIATGFQTKDEREKENSNKKIISMLEPEVKPLVKPVNEFINPVKAAAATTAAATEPYMKQKDEPKQTGLFDMFAARSEEKEEVVFRYNLEEEAAEEESESDTAGFTFKMSEPESYTAPVAREERRMPEPPAPVPVPEPEPVVGADDHKTNESIEEQLKKSRERIMRLKDLSMKLRSGNIQELENVPAYKRKEIALQETPQSDESQISRFSLMPDSEGNTEIRKNNSFLHDNAD
ncbi:MAG: cell division protein FtsZ, partial [Mucilaginibacter sp.]